MLELPSRRRLALNLAFLVLTVMYFVEGPWASTDVWVFGWPLFALWAVVIGPAAIIAVFAIDSYYNLKTDDVRTDQSTGTASEFGGE